MLRKITSLIAFALVLGGCAAPKKAAETSEPVKKYQLKGEVLSVDAQTHSAKIKHEKIEGWMEAMTMDYPVKDQADLAKLATGQAITATVFVQGQDFWIGEINATGAKP
jgi:protein SCO1/2